jgi:acetylglutamate kinase
MQDFTGRTIVLRVDESSLGETTLVSDIAFLQQHAVRPIVVAPQAELARAFVGVMNRIGDAAVGLRGADAGMIPAAGGGIGSVQTRLLETLTRSGYVPVIEPTAIGLRGDDVQLPVDDVARAIAEATDASRILFFDTNGGVVDAETQQLIDELTPAEALAIADAGYLAPSLAAAIRAAALGVRGGVGAAQIIDGRIAHATIVELLTARHLGTQVAGTVLIVTP